jgi:chromate transporter
MKAAGRGPRSPVELMRGLAGLGLAGFGGVGPQAYHFFVERLGWLDADEFAERYSLAQALPGANVVNLCAIVGDTFFGPVGAAAAVAAITVPPLIIAVAAASAVAHLARAPHVASAEAAVVAASAGLLFATAYRVLATVRHLRLGALVLAASVMTAVVSHVLSMPIATLIAIAAGWAIVMVKPAAP